MDKTKAESEVEKRLTEEVQKLGGECLKFVSPSMAGVPDRIILLPGGIVAFTEVKRAGKKPEPHQRRFLQWLQENGFTACTVCGDEGVDQLLQELRAKL